MIIRKLIGAAAGVVIALSASVVLADGQIFTATIQHVATGRYVDAHVTADRDYSIVTRTFQNNKTQQWILTKLGGLLGGGIFRIISVSNGRYWDAHVTADRDYGLVTRPYQNNDTQRWKLTDMGDGTRTIQQVTNGRYVDAHDTADKDFRIVTRPYQRNTTQRWRIKKIADNIKNCLPVIGCF